MALLIAFSLQDQVEKYGPYVGLAAFLGLAILTVLYFAQAHELRRTGAEPAAERSGIVGPAQPVPQPTTVAPAPSGNGRGTGTLAPIPPGPRPAVAVAAAAAQVLAGEE